MDMYKMKKYDCYLCYSQSDSNLANQLIEYLTVNGVTVFYARNSLPRRCNYVDFLENTIEEIMRNTGFMVILFSKNSVESKWVNYEINIALKTAKNRNKQIVPILIDGVKLPLEYKIELSNNTFFNVNTTDSLWVKSISPFLQSINLSKKKAILYEELSELIKSKLYLEASDRISEIIGIIILQINPLVSLRHQSALIIELDQCLEKQNVFYDYCDGDYSKKAREVTQHKLDMLKKINELAKQIQDDKEDFFLICCKIRLIYWDREIRWDCADMITHGDVSMGNVHTLPQSDYAEKQKEYRHIYNDNNLFEIIDESDVVQTFIRETEKYLYLNEPKKRNHISKKQPSTQDEKLEAIARYIREGNRIFELIGQDEKAVAFMRCLITSYERLRNYCQEIGASNLTAECIKRITDLRSKLQQVDDDSQKEHTTAEKGIRALLGFTQPGTGEYDVFLSHRGNDSDIARDVYIFLKSHMKEVFFDDVSLSGELSDTDYTNAIYQALDKSKHFLVIITDVKEMMPDYQIKKNDWMQLEMSVFHRELIEGRKSGSNFIIVVTPNVYDQIIAANKTNMDLKWRNYTLIKLNECQDKIIGYLKD